MHIYIYYEINLKAIKGIIELVWHTQGTLMSTHLERTCSHTVFLTSKI